MFSIILHNDLSWLCLLKVSQQIDGACYDLGYDTQTVQNMSRIGQFPSVSAKILQAVELKTQLDAVDNKRDATSTDRASLDPAESILGHQESTYTSINADTLSLIHI